jgi:hypothetical protein
MSANQAVVMASDVQAVPVDSPVQKVQVPIGLKAGETFIHTFSNERVVTVTVPVGVTGGQFIEVGGAMIVMWYLVSLPADWYC